MASSLPARTNVSLKQLRQKHCAQRASPLCSGNISFALSANVLPAWQGGSLEGYIGTFTRKIDQCSVSEQTSPSSFSATPPKRKYIAPVRMSSKRFQRFPAKIIDITLASQETRSSPSSGLEGSLKAECKVKVDRLPQPLRSSCCSCNEKLPADLHGAIPQNPIASIE